MTSNNSMYVSIDWDKIHPKLNGFENVVGRKFNRCGDCKYTTPHEEYPDSLVDCKLYKTFYYISHKKCKRFRGLSLKAINEIKLHDYEYYPAGKINTHPTIPVQWFDDENFNVIVMMNLPLIL